MANKYEDKICEAISTIVEQAVSSAGYDRTIQAIVSSCSDATIGKYKVKYQDSSFYAYATSADVTYTNGSNVYVLVPGNDMTRDKTILGTVSKLGINYINNVEGDAAYDYVGNNCIVSDRTFKLSSYAKHNTPNISPISYVEIIYAASSNNNRIAIDQASINEYIKQSSSLICGAFFRTSFPAEQQYQGNYGIIYGLDFYDNASANEQGKVVTRYYTVDVDNMTGNPYGLTLGKRQYEIYDIDGANFKQVSSISIFTKDFSHHKNNIANFYDIEISQIELCGAIKMSDDEINGCGISFYTPDGSFFPANTTDPNKVLKIQAQVKMKGKLVDSKSQKIPFYWFVEDLSILPQSERYNKYGRRGWRCLNNYNLIEEETADTARQVEWIAYGDTWSFKYEDATAKENRIKCAIVYDNTVYTKEIVIKNMAGGRALTIESDLGTQFYYDIGRPTLTCKVDGQLLNDWSYSWAVEDAYGNLTNLPINTAENKKLIDDYDAKKNELDALKAQIAASKRFENEASAELTAKQSLVDEYKYVQRVSIKDGNPTVFSNKVYNVAVNEITNFVKYKCSAFDSSGTYRGTAALTLTNTLDTEGIYTLVINNGTQNYKYSEFGVSPASKAADNPIQLSALTFNIFDNLGNPINEDILKHCDIKWKVPIKNTMFENFNFDASAIPGATDAQQENQYYTKSMIVSYGIANKFNYSKNNNTIELTVDYKGMSLTAKTNITFIKEGQSGTNGTDYTCKIVPNTSDTNIPFYPTFSTVEGTGTGSFGWDGSELTSEEFGNAPFIVKLYKAGEEIYSGSTSGRIYEEASSGRMLPITITWSMLKNSYKPGYYSDRSNFDIEATTGKMRYIDDGYFEYGWGVEDKPANIIKCTVTYGYANIAFASNFSSDSENNKYTIYATLPIIISKVINSNFSINLNENSGFRYVTYSSDGTTPKYDNTNPFEIKVYENINGIKEDISLINDSHAVGYEFRSVGATYNFRSRYMRDSDDLSVLDNSTSYMQGLNKNQMYFKPEMKYYGLCVTNAVVCYVYRGSYYNDIPIGYIHIPIHFMLNKYGLAELNGWDGNSININNDEGYIIAPEMGAGKKETDNTFTGVLMGKTQMPDRTTPDIGILGFSHGERTILLDAEYGHAIFGKGNGKIAIDPTQNQALLYSNNFWTNYNEKGLPDNYTYRTSATSDSGVTNYQPAGNCNEEGLLINLTNAEIFAGSGNFYVDGENGYLHARGGGDIGGWRLNDYQIDSNNGHTGMNSVFDKTKAGYREVIAPLPTGDETKAAAFWAGGSRINPSFCVTHDGYLRCNDATIGSGSDRIYIGRTSEVNSDGTLKGYSALYTSKKSQLTADATGFYIGTDGFALGDTHAIDYDEGGFYLKTVSKFQVDSNGVFYAKEGYLGSSIFGWKIGDKYLRNGNGGAGKTAYNDGEHDGVYIGTDGIGLGKKDSNGAVPFCVSRNGELYARRGAIANWSITNNSIRTASFDWDGIAVGEYPGMYIGENGIRLNTYFSVSSRGNLYAASGTIGGWYIGTNELSGGNITMHKSGQLSCSVDGNIKWALYNYGNATFNNIAANSGTIGGIRIENGTFKGLSAGAVLSDGSSSGFSLSNGGILKASGAEITGAIKAQSLEILGNAKCSGVKLYTDGDHYIYFGTGGNMHPTLSGINLGSGGIQTSDGASGQTFKDGVDGTADITFVSSIDSVKYSGNSVTLSFKTRKLRFYDGICTNCSNAVGDSVSDQFIET